MATQIQVSQTIDYRGPPILVGALAHLFREVGLDLERPRDDRNSVAEVVEVTLTVTSGATAIDQTLDVMVDTAVARFRRRFGDSPASVSVGDNRGTQA